MQSFFGAGLEITIDSPCLQQHINTLTADTFSTTISASRHKKLLHRYCSIPLHPLCHAQSAHPVIDSRERVRLATRIKDEQRHSYIIQMQLVDKAITRLSRQVPQPRLAILFAFIAKFGFTTVECPHIAPVC